MFWPWWKEFSRKRILKKPFPENFDTNIQALHFYSRLSVSEKKNLRAITKVIFYEKNWEGCGGFKITDEVKTLISAQAARVILNIKHDYYSRAMSILVYPDRFIIPQVKRSPLGHGVIQKEKVVAHGQAFFRGPVILSWSSILEDMNNPFRGRNVVIHEFAHKLDMLADSVDGTPLLSSRKQYKSWVKIMTDEYQKLVWKYQTGTSDLIDFYGATNPAEFFSVTSEYYFMVPHLLKMAHPELFHLLASYYDPKK
ncbi:zinc-dependent peptidase [bacterium]|nr:zinc-dependent peptidase [bacterium]